MLKTNPHFLLLEGLKISIALPLNYLILCALVHLTAGSAVNATESNRLALISDVWDVCKFD